jgi:hypothetical protein
MTGWRKRKRHFGGLAFALGLLAMFLTAGVTCAQAAQPCGMSAAAAPCHDKMPMSPACGSDCALACLPIVPTAATLPEPAEWYAPLKAPLSADLLEGLTIQPPRPPPR